MLLTNQYVMILGMAHGAIPMQCADSSYLLQVPHFPPPSGHLGLGQSALAPLCYTVSCRQ